MIRVQGYVQDYDVVCLNGDLFMQECHYSMWCVLPLTWILNPFGDLKIQFDFKSNLTSAISNFSKLQHLASYVSRHNAMAYDNNPDNMMKSISSVIGDGLQDVKELFLQSKKVVTIWLANDGRLGVQSILKELCNIRW